MERRGCDGGDAKKKLPARSHHRPRGEEKGDSPGGSGGGGDRGLFCCNGVCSGDGACWGASRLELPELEDAGDVEDDVEEEDSVEPP